MTPKVSGSPEPIEGRCGAKLRGTNPPRYCKNPPLKYQTKCRRCGGASPQAKRKAEERAVMAEIVEEMGVLGIQPDYDKVNPVDVMARMLAAVTSEERWLAVRVSRLTGDEILTWSRTEHETGIGPMGAIDKETFKAVPAALVEQLRTARDRVMAYAEKCIRLGLDERRVAMIEGQAAQMVGAVQRVITALNLTPEQIEQAHTLLAREFRALEGEA